MNYAVIFYTHSGAIKFDKKMKKLNILCSLQPVPRKLSSSCGICAKISYDNNIDSLLGDEIQNIYIEISKNQFELVFEHHIS